jgi:hypothetical protein
MFARPPFHYCAWYGDTGLFMFDLRGERDYRADRVVGEIQWRALDDFLREAGERGVPTIFLGLSVPLVHFSPRVVRLIDWLPGHQGENVRDRWDATNISGERDRLLEALFEWESRDRRRQAVVLSGDVHAGAAFHVFEGERGDGKGMVAQWTSSALTSPGGALHTVANVGATRLVNAGSAGRRKAERVGVEPKNNFGFVEVEPLPGGGHELRLTIQAYAPGWQSLKPSVRDVLRPRV